MTDPQQPFEKIFALAKGAKGDEGEPGRQGAQGEPGPSLPRRQRRSIVWLFLFTVVLAVLNLVANQVQVHEDKVAQQRQGAIVELKLCTAFRGLYELKPPAGNAAANPSRAFEQGLHVKLDQVGAAIGCTSKP